MIPVFGIAVRAALVGILLAALLSAEETLDASARGGTKCERAPVGPKGTLSNDPKWQSIPAGPVDGRVAASVIWTGQEVIVWGGEVGPQMVRQATGAAFDPGRGTWRPLPDAPLSPRSEHVAIWTGKDMIVWPGIGHPDPVTDAAAYNPKLNRWRRIPNAPIFPTASPVGVWSGAEMIVWQGRTDGGAAFDPARNRWRRIPQSLLSPRRNAAVVWTGCEVVIWGGQSTKDWGYLGDGATYNPTTKRWKRLPGAPLGTERIPNTGSVPGFPPVITARGFIHPNAVWSGGEVLVSGYLYAFRVGAPQAMPLAGYNPKTNAWRARASPPIEFARQTDGTGGDRTVWVGDSMIAWTGNIDVRGLRTLRYDPNHDRWSELAGPGTAASLLPSNAELVFTGKSVIALASSGSFMLT